MAGLPKLLSLPTSQQHETSKMPLQDMTLIIALPSWMRPDMAQRLSKGALSSVSRADMCCSVTRLVKMCQD